MRHLGQCPRLTSKSFVDFIYRLQKTHSFGKQPDSFFEHYFPCQHVRIAGTFPRLRSESLCLSPIVGRPYYGRGELLTGTQWDIGCSKGGKEPFSLRNPKTCFVCKL